MKISTIVVVLVLFFTLSTSIKGTEATSRVKFYNPLFDSFFDNFPSYSKYYSNNNVDENRRVNRITPSSDVFETETEIIIQTNLPGVSSPSVEIEGADIIISGKFDFESFPFLFKTRNTKENNVNKNKNIENNNVKSKKANNNDDDDENINVNFNEENEKMANVDNNIVNNEVEEGENRMVFEGRYLQRERSLQRENDEYYQKFHINVNFDEKNIEAKMKNGLLTIIIPKLQPIKVPIFIS